MVTSSGSIPGPLRQCPGWDRVAGGARSRASHLASRSVANMDANQRAWMVLRSMRSYLPAMAGTSEDRRLTFQAALEQAEELWGASGTVGPTVSPIILFYGLTQAARALRSSLDSSDQWGDCSGHGMTLLDPTTTPGIAPALDEIQIRPRGNKFIQCVAPLLKSEALATDVTVSDLVLSLPRVHGYLSGDAGVRPISVEFNDIEFTSTLDSISLTLSPLPASLERRDPTETTMVQPSPEEIREWLNHYPSVANLGHPNVEYINPMHPDYTKHCIKISWALTMPTEYHDRREIAVGVIGADLNSKGSYVSGNVLPTVAGNKESAHPLITWWMILFAFSMLARYHSRIWGALLDINSSPSAVPIGLILDDARQDVPQLFVNEILARLRS